MDLAELRREQYSPNAMMRNFVSTYTFIDIGNISEVYGKGERVDVQLPYKLPDDTADIIKGVELLQLGNADVSIKLTPKVGDSVIVLLPRNLLVTTEHNHENATRNSGYYNTAGFKALLVQGTPGGDPSVTITIDDEQVAVIAKQPITLDSKDSVTINGHLKVTA